MRLMLFAASRFPVLLGKASLLEKKSKGDRVRGKLGCHQQSRTCSGLQRDVKEMSSFVSSVWYLFKVKDRWVLHEDTPGVEFAFFTRHWL